MTARFTTPAMDGVVVLMREYGGVRSVPTVLHLDLDAFYASVEQAAKPSLRGKPVIVGGIGPRGVVATASYEARRYGVHSAMAMAHARRLCPNAAYLVPRFAVYRQISDRVMDVLNAMSPLVEPLSLDEAFVDLEAGPSGALLGRRSASETAKAARTLGQRLRAEIAASVGLTGSVGLASSKMLAKIASEAAKPDGLRLVEPGLERATLDPLPVRALPGVGPATAEHLRRMGITTVAALAEAGEAELVRLLGNALGGALHTMAQGIDNRPVVADRELKSVSVEDTFDVDLADRTQVKAEIDRQAVRCVERLRASGRSGRTIVIKVRRFDFTTLTRSETLRAPTDDPMVVREVAQRLLEGVDTTGGVRLLGVGVTGLADFTQEDLFAQSAAARVAEDEAAAPAIDMERRPDHSTERPVNDPDQDLGAGTSAPEPRRWTPGQDVHHTRFGPGWVQGSGLGRVTVRFEVPGSRPGRVYTFAVDDEALTPSEALPLVPIGQRDN